jgi:hypothetical protein
LILKPVCAFRLELRNGLLVCAQVKTATERKREVGTVPKPENIRRIVTGPKPANKSIRKSRSMECRSRTYTLSRRTPGAVSSRLGRMVNTIAKSNNGGYGSRLKAGTTNG